jgi:hypothetical protein
MGMAVNDLNLDAVREELEARGDRARERLTEEVIRGG